VLVCREPVNGLDDLARAQTGSGGRVRLLLLDGVQDPGNAGTLVRAAAAFALDGVVALDGTVDLFNPKVVRASAGCVFRIPLVHESWVRFGAWLGRIGARVIAADAGGEDVAAWRPSGSWALVVGSEGAGVRAEISRAASASVRVPMPGGVESLNAAVAGSILLYMMTRERNVG
jgi:TrmH family RNA methyltransferase